MPEDPLPRTGWLRYLPVASPAAGQGPPDVPAPRGSRRSARSRGS